MEKKLIIKKAIVIYAPIGKVWQVLTDPRLSQLYMFGCAVISDWKPGSTIEYKEIKSGITLMRGKILNIVPEKILQFSCLYSSSRDIPRNYSTVTFELIMERERLSTLSLTQGDFSGIENGKNRYAELLAEWDYTLNVMKNVLEK